MKDGTVTVSTQPSMEEVGAVYALEALEDGGFEGFEVFKGEFVVEGNVEAVVWRAGGV